MVADLDNESDGMERSYCGYLNRAPVSLETQLKDARRKTRWTPFDSLEEIASWIRTAVAQRSGRLGVFTYIVPRGTKGAPFGCSFHSLVSHISTRKGEYEGLFVREGGGAWRTGSPVRRTGGEKKSKETTARTPPPPGHCPDTGQDLVLR